MTSFPARSSPPLVRTLERPRLSAMLERSWTVPLTVVAAPAGSGKSWLLAGFAQAEHTADRMVLWYQADRATVDDVGLVRHLFGVLEGAGLVSGPAPSSVADFVESAQGARPVEIVLVVDDAHVLGGSPAEEALGRLISHLPPWLHLAVLSRQPPRVDLSRLRVADQVLEIGPDELRFRSWEVEDLFRRHLGHEVPPEEIAELARRTGGWAAGLHLFHLAITGKPAAYRRHILVSLPTRLRTYRDYLTENILAGLEGDLRSFLIDSCVLDILSGAMCDALLGRNDSAVVLEELSARHPFLTTNDAVTYWMHEVLRGHLEQLLFERLGEEGARQSCLRAACILEAEGALGEAWRAYCRAQDWESARRLLHSSSGELLDVAAAWPEAMSGALAGSDAWVLLARARRQVLALRWRQARDTFRQAEGLADVPRLARTCTAELMALEGWVEPSATPLIGWSGTLRQALTDGPAATAQHAADEPIELLVTAVACVLAGSPSRAWDLLSNGLDSPSQTLEHWATLVAALAGCLLGRPGSQELAATALAGLEPTLPPCIARLLGTLPGGEAGALADAALTASEALADTANPWVEAVLALVAGAAALFGGGGDARRAADRSLQLASELGSRTLQAWSSVLLGLVAEREGAAPAAPQLLAAERLSRSVGCPGAALLAAAVREGEGGGGVAGEPPGLSAADVAVWLRAARGLRRLPTRLEPATEGGEVRLRCLGDFELRIGGTLVDISRAQPKVRAVLQLLAVNAGRVVHRDRLAADLWPGNADAATRNVQVAISSLRKFLDAAGAPDETRHPGGFDEEGDRGFLPSGAGALVARRGDGYLLDLTSEQADVLVFNDALRAAQAARGRHEDDGAVAAWRAALEAYGGELLAGAGTADWLVDEREVFRTRAAEAAEQLAAHLLEDGDPAEALRVAGRGLEIDRYRDGLWRTTVSAHEQSADYAAAARATADYARMLDDLGVSAPQAPAAGVLVRS